MNLFLRSIVVVLALSASLRRIPGAPVPTLKNLKKTASFLFTFGYLDLSNPDSSAGANDPKSSIFQNAISQLQRFGNVPVTGKLDSTTLQLINTDRCGVKDPQLPSGRRSQLSIGEFTLHSTLWKKKDLTFKIINFTRDGIFPDVQRQIFRTSFKMWEAASGLRITEVYFGNADILVSFVRKNHGDGYPFDDEGGTLAHAFYPLNNEGLAGDAHFDDDERFTTGKSEGINLDWVAVHEFGHSLGLEHSNVRESIMYPWYKGYIPNIQLTNDDIQGIQTLYGKPTNEPPTTQKETTKAATTTPLTTTTTSTTTNLPKTPTRKTHGHPACRPSARYDAVFVGANKRTYFITGNVYWTLNSWLSKSKPKRVRIRWPQISAPVDSAYRNRQGFVVFFKGSQFWEYNDHPRRPRLRRSGHISGYNFPAEVKNMDAIFSWKENNKTYIFKGEKYWRYDEDTNSMGARYPRKIMDGWGLPSQIDAVTTWINGRSYVFKSQQYIRLKRRSQRQSRTTYIENGYPQSISSRWMRCRQVTGRLAIAGSLQSSP